MSVNIKFELALNWATYTSGDEEIRYCSGCHVAASLSEYPEVQGRSAAAQVDTDRVSLAEVEVLKKEAAADLQKKLRAKASGLQSALTQLNKVVDA